MQPSFFIFGTHLDILQWLRQLMQPSRCAAVPSQELRLEQVQGSGAMLAPLATMHRLASLELAACHLSDADSLRAALCSATGLASLRVQVGCSRCRGPA